MCGCGLRRFVKSWEKEEGKRAIGDGLFIFLAEQTTNM